jgi:DNA-binding IscR family transcriptional regulator
VKIDGQLHVVTAESRPGQRLWRICSGGSCLVHRNLQRLMAAYRDLLISQGRPVGDE